MRRRFFPNFFGSRLWGDEGDDGLKTERSKRALDIDALLFLLVGIFFFVGVGSNENLRFPFGGVQAPLVDR